VLYPKDKRVTVDRGKDRLSISWNLPKGNGWALVLMGILVSGLFLVVGFVPSRYGEPRTIADAAIGIGLAVLIGVPLNYFGVAYLIGSARMEADHNVLKFSFGPFWVRRAILLPASTFLQFYVVRASTSSLSAALYYLDRDEVSHPLTTLLPSQVGAFQICHELTDFYDLQEQEIFGITSAPHHPGIRK